MGLSGLGDLVLTATGDLSRNRRVGLLLAQGLPLAQDPARAGPRGRRRLLRGRWCARGRSALGVEMPITEAVVAVLDGRLHAARRGRAAHGARGAARTGTSTSDRRWSMQRRRVLQAVAAGAARLSLPSFAQRLALRGRSSWSCRFRRAVRRTSLPASSPTRGRAARPAHRHRQPPRRGRQPRHRRRRKAEPDGYTFLFTIQGPLVTAPMSSKALNYDPVKDLAPVSLVATSPNVLVGRPEAGREHAGRFRPHREAEEGRAELRQRGQRQPGAPGDGVVQDTRRQSTSCTCPTRASRRS